MVYWGYVHVSLWYRLCVYGMLLYLCMVCVVCELGYVCYEFTHVATTTMWLFVSVNTEPGAALCSHALPTGFLSPFWYLPSNYLFCIGSQPPGSGIPGIVSSLTCLLGTKLPSSTRSAISHNCRAISLASHK